MPSPLPGTVHWGSWRHSPGLHAVLCSWVWDPRIQSEPQGVPLSCLCLMFWSASDSFSCSVPQHLCSCGSSCPWTPGCPARGSCVTLTTVELPWLSRPEEPIYLRHPFYFQLWDGKSLQLMQRLLLPETAIGDWLERALLVDTFHPGWMTNGSLWPQCITNLYWENATDVLIMGTDAFICLFLYVLQFSVRGYAWLYACTSIICVMPHGLPQGYLVKQLLAALTRRQF